MRVRDGCRLNAPMTPGPDLPLGLPTADGKKRRLAVRVMGAGAGERSPELGGVKFSPPDACCPGPHRTGDVKAGALTKSCSMRRPSGDS
jgi:hypothetical protein